MPLESIPTQLNPATVASGTKIAADIIDGSLEVVQYVKLVDGTINGVAPVLAPAGALYVDVRAAPTITITGQGTSGIPDGGIVTVQGAPGGATPIPVSGTLTGITNVVHVDDNAGSVTVDTGTPGTFNINNISGTIASHPVTNAGIFAVQADTELPAAVAPGDAVTIATLGNTLPAVQGVTLGYNGGTYDRLRVGVAGAAISGTPPGVLYVQGIGALGAVPVSGSLSIGGVTEGTPAIADPTGPQIMARRVDSTGTPPFLVLPNQVAADQNVALNATGFGELRVSDLQNYNQINILTNATWSDAHVWAAADNGHPQLLLMDESPPAAMTGSKFGLPRISPNRSQYMQIRDGTSSRAERGVEVTTNNALRVEALAGGLNVNEFNLAQLNLAGNTLAALGDHGIAPLVMRKDTAAPFGGIVDGEYTILQVDASNRLWTNGVVGGAVATNVVIASNPVNLGVQAVSAENAVVTTGRMVQLVADLVGKQIVLPYANPENFVQGAFATAVVDTTSTPVIGASGTAAIRNYVTSLTITNAHATVGTLVKLLDGAALLWQGYAAPGGGGMTVTFPTPLKGSGNTAINAQAVTTGASLMVSASGYRGV
jgi:hypothetical protein